MCGNSPTNHLAAYLISTLFIWETSLSRRFCKGDNLFTSLGRRLRDFFSKLEHTHYGAAIRVGLIRVNTDPTRAATYRSQVIWEEALRRGIPMEQLCVFGSYTDVYRARIKERWEYFESLPIPTHLMQDSYEWIDDKFLLFGALTAADIPVPRTYSVRSEHAALQAFNDLEGAAVTKPRTGSRGRHTTTSIQSEEELRRAFRSARMLSRYVCVSKSLSGSVCRGTLVQGELAGFFQADPPRLTGDGASSIRELVARKNQEKPERVEMIMLTDEHGAFLERRYGYTFDSIPADGMRIDLTHRTGRLFGGETCEHGRNIHPKLRAHLENAAHTLGVPVVGFDLIIEDPMQDPDTQEWGIIEANSLPFIDLHYLPLYGVPSNVAAQVWDLWSVPKNV